MVNSLTCCVVVSLFTVLAATELITADVHKGRLESVCVTQLVSPYQWLLIAGLADVAYSLYLIICCIVVERWRWSLILVPAWPIYAWTLVAVSSVECFDLKQTLYLVTLIIICVKTVIMAVLYLCAWFGA